MMQKCKVDTFDTDFNKLRLKILLQWFTMYFLFIKFFEINLEIIWKTFEKEFKRIFWTRMYVNKNLFSY